MIERIPTNAFATCDQPCPNCPIAHDPDSDETWTLTELIEHANGCEEQIDFLLATQNGDDWATYAHQMRCKVEVPEKALLAANERIEELETELAPFRAASTLPIRGLAPKTPQERLVAVYRELQDIVAPFGTFNSSGALGDPGRDQPRDPGAGAGAYGGRRMNRLWLVLVALDAIDSQRLTVADLVLLVGVRVGAIEAREVVVDLIDSGCVQVRPERTVLITSLGQGIRRRLPELVAEVDDILMQEWA